MTLGDEGGEDGDGKRKEEEREKVVGACVIAYGVFQPPDVVLVTCLTVGTFHKLSHPPATFARLSSHLCIITISHPFIVCSSLTK